MHLLLGQTTSLVCWLWNVAEYGELLPLVLLSVTWRKNKTPYETIGLEDDRRQREIEMGDITDPTDSFVAK